MAIKSDGELFIVICLNPWNGLNKRGFLADSKDHHQKTTLISLLEENSTTASHQEHHEDVK